MARSTAPHPSTRGTILDFFPTLRRSGESHAAETSGIGRVAEHQRQPSTSELEEAQQQDEEQQQDEIAGTAWQPVTERDGNGSKSASPLPERLAPSQSQPRLAFDLLRGLDARCASGLLGRTERALLRGRLLASYAQLAAFPQFMPCHCVLIPGPAQRGGGGAFGGAALAPPAAPRRLAAAPVACAQFDGQGELLASASLDGYVTLHDWLSMRHAALQRPAPSSLSFPNPLLVLQAPAPRLQAVRWDPLDANCLAAAGLASRSVWLYDLSMTQGDPKAVLTAGMRAFGGGADAQQPGSGCGGFHDVQLGRAAPGVVAAAGPGGSAYVWDARAGSSPRAVLPSPGGAAIRCLQLSPDGSVLAAGTDAAHVVLWDLRGGSNRAGGGAPGAAAAGAGDGAGAGSAAPALTFGARGPYQHQQLGVLSLAAALAAVPGLAAQSGGQRSVVSGLQAHPQDPALLAFHLANGWSGVLDTVHGRVTHVHAPPPAWALTGDAQGGRGGLDDVALAELQQQQLQQASAAHQGLMAARLEGYEFARMRPASGCWAQGSDCYAVTSEAGDALNLLDFSGWPGSPCLVGGAGDDSDEGDSGAGAGESDGGGSPRLQGRGRRRRRYPRLPAALAVPVSSPVLCCDSHPHTDELVGGTASGELTVLGPRRDAGDSGDTQREQHQ